MAEITKMSVHKTIKTGEYQFEKIGLDANLSPTDDPVTVYNQLANQIIGMTRLGANMRAKAERVLENQRKYTIGEVEWANLVEAGDYEGATAMQRETKKLLGRGASTRSRDYDYDTSVED